MRVGVIGTGYVGIPTGVGLAEIGHEVLCYDKSREKISSLQDGRITLFEDGLEELFTKNTRSGRLMFTSSLQECVESSEVIIIAVGTPPHPITKEADMKYVHAVAVGISLFLREYKVIVVKSTVPVGTGDAVEGLIRDQEPDTDFDVVSIPEFLREGFAVHDFFNPDRIVVGANNERAAAVIRELYKPFEGKAEMIFVKRRSSEIIKYASNAFLAMKIHYINEMANLCEKTGADIKEVALGMGLDSRIGPKFLRPGPGYGGSCFPKDTCAITYVAKQNGVNLTLVDTAIEGNNRRREEMAGRILKEIENVKSPKIAVLGLAFKDGTDDARESPAVEIIQKMLAGEKLLETKLRISAYDPKASKNARQILGDSVVYADDMYEAINEAHVLAILTEWPEFAKIDLERAKRLMHQPIIVDLRNVMDGSAAKAAGFKYSKIGHGELEEYPADYNGGMRAFR